MSYLYVCEQGAVIGISGNRFTVKYRDGLQKSVPAETLEVIEIFGNVQLTSQSMQECMARGIDTCFYSKRGSYFGRLKSMGKIHTSRQRQQAKLYEDNSFLLPFAKRILKAKITNQIVMVRRYSRNSKADEQGVIVKMQNSIHKLEGCTSIDMLMGYEGIAAREYFKALGNLVSKEFQFQGRSRRPPMDPFNSMISLGYSILFNEIYGKLESKGMNPYFGFMHRDKEKHATLVSDLMEEWRAVLVDSTVMSLINGHEISLQHFESGLEEPGVFLTKEGMAIFFKKLEAKFRTEAKYLSYINYPVSFRRALDLQVNQIAKAVENEDAFLYMPVVIR